MNLVSALQNNRKLYIQQKKNWVEIIVDFETANRYAIMDEGRNVLGMIAERGEGFFDVVKRWFFRSHRGFRIEVVNNDGASVLQLSRGFFFFFSDLFVADNLGRQIGTIHRRFGIIYKKYDLRGENGVTFATIKSPFWRLWTFPVLDDRTGRQTGEIGKRWGGMIKEVFTDADTFRIMFDSGSSYTLNQKLLIFAAAISIDFDFFEKNQSNR
ncbi:MAG: phospholipid scramblase-related protein [Oligoflexales bacterium]